MSTSMPLPWDCCKYLLGELPNPVWTHFPRWFRTLPKHGYPSEQIVRIALQHQQEMI